VIVGIGLTVAIIATRGDDEHVATVAST